MANVVTKAGAWSISVGDSPSRAETPLLEMRNLTPGNIARIICNFYARTNTPGRSEGFYFNLQAVNAKEVEVLTPNEGVFQSSDGWQSVTLIGLFRVKHVSESPTEDIDFELLFRKNDLSGNGQLLNFVMTGEIVATVE